MLCSDLLYSVPQISAKVKAHELNGGFNGGLGAWNAVMGFCRQKGRCAFCGLRFTTEDVIEVHHHDENHNNNGFDNLRLMHGHCHDIVHGSRCS